MRIVVESVLDCPVEAAWAEIQTSRLLSEVASPVVTIRPLPGETLPPRWEAGTIVCCRVALAGLVPLGVRTLVFERIDPARHEIQTREADPLVRRWDHRIVLMATADGRCRYRDRIDVEAGRLTPLVGLFAHAFYRHRHRRWRAVARRLAAGGLPDDRHPVDGPSADRRDRPGRAAGDPGEFFAADRLGQRPANG